VVAFYFFIFSGKAFRFQFDFFRQRLGFSRLRSIGNIYKNYYGSSNIIDKIVLMSRMKNPFRLNSKGEDYLRQMVMRE